MDKEKLYNRLMKDKMLHEYIGNKALHVPQISEAEQRKQKQKTRMYFELNADKKFYIYEPSTLSERMNSVLSVMVEFEKLVAHVQVYDKILFIFKKRPEHVEFLKPYKKCSYKGSEVAKIIF